MSCPKASRTNIESLIKHTDGIITLFRQMTPFPELGLVEPGVSPSESLVLQYNHGRFQ